MLKTHIAVCLITTALVAAPAVPDPQERPQDLKVFVNTLLGEGWRHDEGYSADERALASRVEQFGLDAIPVEVLTITCGVDVQKDRLETTLCG